MNDLLEQVLYMNVTILRQTVSFRYNRLAYGALIISEGKDSGVLGEKEREVGGGMYKIGA